MTCDEIIEALAPLQALAERIWSFERVRAVYAREHGLDGERHWSWKQAQAEMPMEIEHADTRLLDRLIEAKRPGSMTGCIKLPIKAWSTSVGSHSPWCASHAASLITRPSGDTLASANAPIRRWKARWGSLSSASMP